MRLGRTDAYAFYVQPEDPRQMVKVHRRHSVWRYLFRYLIWGWKIESDLWHHPRKYVMPAIMMLLAGLVSLF